MADALTKFDEFVQAQEGNLSIKRPIGSRTQILAAESGFIQRINSERIGMAIIEMGGGRKQMVDTIDHSVGVEVLVEIGDAVEAGQPIANMFCDATNKSVELAKSLVELSFGISSEACGREKLILERVGID